VLSSEKNNECCERSCCFASMIFCKIYISNLRKLADITKENIYYFTVP
jgi:hypothetical protein